jgi:transposase
LRLLPAGFLYVAERCVTVLPPGRVPALGAVLEQIADMTVKIKAYDRAIIHLT